MTATRPWMRGVRMGAAAVLGLGLVLPVVSACSSSSGEETEQVEESNDEDSGEDLEESDPEPDIEE